METTCTGRENQRWSFLHGVLVSHTWCQDTNGGTKVPLPNPIGRHSFFLAFCQRCSGESFQSANIDQNGSQKLVEIKSLVSLLQSKISLINQHLTAATLKPSKEILQLAGNMQSNAIEEQMMKLRKDFKQTPLISRMTTFYAGVDPDHWALLYIWRSCSRQKVWQKTWRIFIPKVPLR